MTGIVVNPNATSKFPAGKGKLLRGSITQKKVREAQMDIQDLISIKIAKKESQRRERERA